MCKSSSGTDFDKSEVASSVAGCFYRLGNKSSSRRLVYII